MTDRAAIFATLTDAEKARLWSKIDVRGPDDCWLWMAQHKKKDGRGVIKFRQIDFQVPRVTLALVDGNFPEGSVYACHECDNPPCCNPAHLWWGTHAENLADAARKGLMYKWQGRRSGHLNPNAKLKPSDVLKIRSDPRTQIEIAAQYGVGETAINNIKHRRTWSNL